MERLKQQLQAEKIRFVENESLAAHCTFKIGGPADVFVQPETEEQLCRVIALCKACDVKYYLLGNGSNILFEDAGYRGVVVDTTAWDPTKNYQRTGLESEYYEILGVNIPSTSIPVSPGRNLAVVLETAAINNRQKRMGYNAAKELLIRLGLDGTVE